MEALIRIGMILTMSVLPTQLWAGDIFQCAQGDKVIFTDNRYACPLASVNPVAVKPQALRVERRLLDNVPDLNQYRDDDVFPARGKKFCAPVAVSNSLSAARGGLESAQQVELAQLLGSEDFMSTGDTGTSPQKLMDGVARYLESTHEQGALSYKGNRKVSGRYNPERTAEVSPEWLMAGIEQKQHIWLNIGWYKRLSNGELIRKGGHWVTLVGYERFGSGADGVKDSLLINDPATQLEASEVINYQPLRQQLVRNKQGKVKYLNDVIALTDGLNKPASADLAILDGAVSLAL
jgi:hypothetical protein